MLFDHKDEELINEQLNPSKTKNDLTPNKRGLLPFGRKLWITRIVPYEIVHSGTLKYTAGRQTLLYAIV